MRLLALVILGGTVLVTVVLPGVSMLVLGVVALRLLGRLASR